MKQSPTNRKDLETAQHGPPEDRIHFAKDRNFFDLEHIDYGCRSENKNIALNFQREIINNIVPRVQPDIIHCNDWMTGMIPAMARQLGIPCLFTIYNTYTEECTLPLKEYIGVDAALFGQNLFYDHYPSSYEESPDSNPADFLSRGVSCAHFVNTMSQTFLMEIIEGQHRWMNNRLQQEISKKWKAGCAVGILNAPDPSFNPVTDKALFCNFSAKDHYLAKQYNKLFLQEKLGLILDPRAPVFFWPYRLDTIHKGCLVLSEILNDIVFSYRNQNIEMVFVAGGEYKKHFQDIIASYQLNNRVAVYNFDEYLSRLAYGACDFVVMLSRTEPCGLPQIPQMIGSLYGALPVVYDTGGLHETVMHMDVENSAGNGFLYKNYDTKGLSRAIKEAMEFYNLSQECKTRQIARVMTQSATSFNCSIMASRYIHLYEKMLERPLLH